ncbi:MAG: insulinase family protein [Gammaproteobacteria bacterium]|nr:insulinase family protein [Gammaproteobacteria bacterium]
MIKNQTHPAFEWKRSKTIDSLNITVEEYQHKKTGALHYHLAADNSENVFLVALRTIPTDSKGVAHILEHTALCGSERYPVRDPFFMMIRRSLNTFMNAFTSSDWTAYPFASQNKKDFNNLLDVYLDAVFFSSLNELDFAQEGHRVEFETADDPNSDLTFKGVVYNEMKGAMSSPVSTLWQTLTEHLFTDNTYHYNSGGEPENIPDLSYDELKEFYKKHYHPSNAIFMTYGNIPAHEHQATFEKRALARFEKQEGQIDVADAGRFTTPQVIEKSYALDKNDADGDKTHIVVGWLLGHSIDLEAQLQAHLLSGVLLDDGASPLRFALENTDLGTAPSPLCGLEDSNKEMSFVCGIEGSRPESSEALEELVLGVLQKVADEGVPIERVESVLHQLELSQREISGDGYPFGLQLILGGLSTAIHRGDPVGTLDLDPILKKLREQIKDPEFIKSLVQKLLIDNSHRIRLTLKPDTELSERKNQAETERLAAIKAAMSEEEKAQIVQLAAELAARQAEQDDPGLLPKVGLEDIPPTLNIARGTSEKVGSFPATFFEQGTNGIIYQQIIIDLPKLSNELLELLPYYSQCLTELGCGDLDYLQTQAWQSSVSGGIGAYSSVQTHTSDIQKIGGKLIFSGKSLVRNHQQLSQLLQKTLKEVRFDEHTRIREIIAQQRAASEQSVTGSGHTLAMLAASSGLGPASALSHRLRGLVGIQSIKQLDDSLQDLNNVKAVADKFRQIHQAVLKAPRQFLMIAEKEHKASLRKDLDLCWSQSTESSNHFTAFTAPEIQIQKKELWVTSTQVNFCAKAYPTIPVDHPDAAPLTVLGGFLRNGYLHRAIREQGGAYGGGASHDADSGAFRFYSYRDPRLSETLDDFDQSIQWLLDEEHEWRLVEEAILGVVSSIDKPASPAGEAKKAFHNELHGRTPEQRRRFRQRVLETTLDDLKRVTRTYLKPEKASVAVISNATTAEQNAHLGLKVIKL